MAAAAAAADDDDDDDDDGDGGDYKPLMMREGVQLQQVTKMLAAAIHAVPKILCNFSSAITN